MELDVIVSQVLPQVKGQSARGEWVRQEVIFEYPDDNYGRRVCVTFWGDKAARATALQVGERVLLSVNIESREHNGRWYTEVRAWRVDAPRVAAPAPAAAPAYAQPSYAQPTAAPAYPSYSTPTAVPPVASEATSAAAPAYSNSADQVDDLPF
ncbi:MAG: DUF3127 domain-containing protein [Rikenellaceae bacterium]